MTIIASHRRPDGQRLCRARTAHSPRILALRGVTTLLPAHLREAQSAERPRPALGGGLTQRTDGSGGGEFVQAPRSGGADAPDRNTELSADRRIADLTWLIGGVFGLECA